MKNCGKVPCICKHCKCETSNKSVVKSSMGQLRENVLQHNTMCAGCGCDKDKPKKGCDCKRK